MDSDADELVSAAFRLSTELSLRLNQLRVSVEAATSQLQQLNLSIETTAKSSGRLACALNWLTAVGAGAALAGVVVAYIAMKHHSSG